MAEVRPESKAGDKPNLNVCCDAVQSKIDQALLQLSGLEQTLKTSSPQPHQVKIYEAVRCVLDAISDVDESTMLLESMPEKEQPDVPCKLLEWLDAGKDPDAFYKQLIDDTIWGSQVCAIASTQYSCYDLDSYHPMRKFYQSGNELRHLHNADHARQDVCDVPRPR